MTIKEIKKYRKDIEILKRENLDKMKEKIHEMINRILKENGEEAYEKETEIMFDNLLYYYMHRGERMPVQCYDLAIQFAEMLIKKENLQRAEEVVLSAASIQKEHGEIEQVKQAEEKEFIALRDEILKINELKSKKLGKRDIESYNIFVQMAQKHDIEQIRGDILAKTEGENGDTPNPNPNPPGPRKRGKLPDYLLPHHRLDFIEKSFPDRKLKFYGGIAKFEDYLIIEIEGMDSVIVEKFFQKTRTGEKKIAQGTDATFIVPKEFVLDLQNLSKSELMEFSEIYDEIKKVNHRKGSKGTIRKDNGELQYDSIQYYTRFKKKFNKSVGYEYFEGFGMDEKTNAKKPKVHDTQRHKRNIKGKTKIKDLVDENPSQEQPDLQPKSTKAQLQEILDSKFEEIHYYTDMLKDATAKKQDTVQISQKLQQTIQELESVNKQIRELGED